METIRKRIHWIDVVRGIGIVLVVLGHTYRDNPALIWIASFHMPMFFILSGWLVGNKKVELSLAFIASKAKSFLVPMIEFCLLTYIYWSLVESRFRAYDIGPMWFLAVLFIVEILAVIMQKYLGNKITVVTFLLIFGVVIFRKINISPYSVYSWIPRIIGGGFLLSSWNVNFKCT